MSNHKFTPHNDQSLNSYLREIRHNPKLTNEQVRNLLDDYQLTGNHRLRERVFQANQLYVVSIAKQYQTDGFELLDLIQEGNIGLLRAIDKYDSNIRVPFILYATWWIKRYISLFITRYPNAITQNTHTQLVFDPEESYMQGREVYIEKLITTPVNSLSQPLGHNGAEDSSTMADLLGFADDVLDNLHQREQTCQIVQQALQTLSETEATILRLSYGIGDANHPSDGISIPDEEIAKRLNLKSSERVRQLREQAQRKLANRISRSFTE